jgi:two-component system CheB/CheR fusion protein
VAPAHALVEIAEGRFLVAPGADPPRPLLPIDYFLYSLANGPDGPGIGIQLSGMGSDGIAGLREVKASGGIVIAQDPATADYDAMPRAAVEAGLADLVLPPEKIAAELPRLAAQLALRSLRPRRPGDTLEIDEEGLGEVFARLRSHSGVDFSNYKLGTIRRRIQRRMVLNRVDTLYRYLRLLAENAGEIKDLYQDLLINVTRFFREPASFQALSEAVFPKLFEGRRFDHPLRVWCRAARPARRPTRSPSPCSSTSASAPRATPSRSSPPTCRSRPSAWRAPASTPRASPNSSRQSGCGASSRPPTAASA